MTNKDQKFQDVLWNNINKPNPIKNIAKIYRMHFFSLFMVP